MGRFIIKHINSIKPQKANDTVVKKENNVNETVKVMTTNEKIAMANEVLNDAPVATRRIKRDKGLIERAESSTTILTEDNKELLKD